jgi:hypothetical protein
MNVTVIGHIRNRYIRIGDLHLAGDQIVMNVNPSYPNQARARKLLTMVATMPVNYGGRLIGPDTPEAFMHLLHVQYSGSYFRVTEPTDIVQKYVGAPEQDVKKYDDSEPRDESGKWTSGGAGAGMSPTQRAMIAHVKEHGGKIIRKPGGFWHAEGAPMDAKGIPEKWVQIQTVRALERKGVLERTNEHPEEWKDSRRLVESKLKEPEGWIKPTPEAFIAARDKNPRPDFFSHLEPGDLADHKLIMNNDGTAGAAVAPDGDVQNIFRNEGAPKGTGAKALAEAVKQGGMTLDAYDYETPGKPGLPDQYRKAGFVETGRMKFNPVFRPQWPADRTPDVVFMAYKGGDQSESPKATNYYAGHEWDKAKADSRAAAKTKGLKPLEDRVAEPVSRHERVNANDYVENILIVGQDGKMIVSKTGGHTGVNLTKDELDNMQDQHATATHNHPEGRSFSLDDVHLAVTKNLSEMRAVTSKFTHRMQPGPAGWPPDADLRAWYLDKDHEVYKDITARIDDKTLTKDEANALHHHEIWARLAAEHQENLRYSREMRT